MTEEKTPVSVTTNALMARYQAAAEYLRRQAGEAEIGIVLGSGLGDYVEALENSSCVAYKDIPGFPVSTAPGHAGCWWAGDLHGKRVCMMQGRVHAYETGDLSDIALYVRVMKLLGVKTLILTNAAGCVNTAWQPGDLMIMTDFINYAGLNPLTGPNLDEFGPRFPDMTHVYDPALIDLCKRQAEQLGLDCVRQGVYMWFLGPSYETPAEIRMARIVGADAVGMSTVPETIVANHCGMKVLGISCLTNMAAGILDQPLNHREVMEVANRVKATFRSLLDETIAAMP